MSEKLLDFVSMTALATKKLRLNFTKHDENYAYLMGYDYGKNGATLKNCHFTIFTSKTNMKAWKQGGIDAKAVSAVV